VRIAYLDESGTPELTGNTSHFVLVALAIPGHTWKEKDQQVLAINRRRGANNPNPTILHNLASVKLARGDPVTAERLSRQAIAIFRHPGVEHLGLPRALRVLGRSLVEQGRPIEAEAAFREAIAENAAAIILIHNHPSGDPTPSSDDRVVTEQLVQAGRILDIPVQDHIIIGRGRYLSFAEAGLL